MTTMTQFEHILEMYEAGGLDEEESVQLFQRLIDTSLIWEMPASYRDQAGYLLHTGACHTSA